MAKQKPVIWFLNSWTKLSPYNLCLVLLIDLYCNETLTSEQKHELAVLLWECIRYENLCLNDLIARLNAKISPTRNIGTEFAEYLEEYFAIRELGSEKLKGLLGREGTIDHKLRILGVFYLRKQSPFGMFLRHMIVSYELSSFEQLSAFITDIYEYIDKKDVISPYLSKKQCEDFFCREVTILQSELVSPLTNAEICEKAQLLSQDCENKVPQAEFLHYMNYLSVREYNLAKKHLHQYFTMLLNNSSDGKNVRYSALNLAALHTVFGNRRTALQYLQESIHLGQQLGEENCLKHCVSWMSYLQGVPLGPTPPEVHEEPPTHLEKLSHMQHVEQYCTSGRSPEEVLALLCRATPTADIAMLDTNASQIFRWYGATLLQELYPFFVVLHLCRGLKKEGVLCSFAPQVEGLCVALCNLALNVAKSEIQGTVSLDILTFAKGIFPPFSAQQEMILLTKNKILFNNNTLSCKPTESNLTAIRSISPRYYSMLADVTYAAHTDNNTTYAAHTDNNTTYAAHTEDDQYLTEVEHRAGVLYRTASHTATTMPHQAVDTLLSLILHCKKYHLQEYLIKSYLKLAQVQISLHFYDQASVTIQSVFVQALASNDLYTQCTARFLYSQVTLAVTLTDRRGMFDKVYRHLSEAMNGFIMLGALKETCNVLYYLARVYDELGGKEERNQCANKFRHYHQLLVE